MRKQQLIVQTVILMLLSLCIRARSELKWNTPDNGVLFDWLIWRPPQNYFVMGLAIKKSANVSVCFASSVMQGFSMLLICVLCALAFFFLCRQNAFYCSFCLLNVSSKIWTFFSQPKAGFVRIIRIMQLLSSKRYWHMHLQFHNRVSIENKARESATRVLSICCRPRRKPHNTVPKFNDAEDPFQRSIVPKAMAWASAFSVNL